MTKCIKVNQNVLVGEDIENKHIWTNGEVKYIVWFDGYYLVKPTRKKNLNYIATEYVTTI